MFRPNLWPIYLECTKQCFVLRNTKHCFVFRVSYLKKVRNKMFFLGVVKMWKITARNSVGNSVSCFETVFFVRNSVSCFETVLETAFLFVFRKNVSCFETVFRVSKYETMFRVSCFVLEKGTKHCFVHSKF